MEDMSGAAYCLRGFLQGSFVGGAPTKLLA